MRPITTLLLAGCAAVALAGLAGLAHAAKPQTHTLVLRAADGEAWRIHYAGDAAPTVQRLAGPIGVFADAALGSPPWAAPAPFAALDAISQRMEREMAAMMAGAEPFDGAPGLAAGPVLRTSLAALPAGAQSYTFVSTAQGGHACLRSVEITSQGPGAAPKVVRKSSGDCGAAAAQPSIGAGEEAISAPGPTAMPVTLRLPAAG